MRFSATAVASALLASSALAVPLFTPNPFSPAPPAFDAPFDVSQAELDSKLSCPGADKTNLVGKKPILLIPGTGNTGGESWDFTYVPLTQQLGYTPCYVSPPPYMLNDSQVNAEYVVNAINRIYAASGNQKVPIMTWSQGGLIAQWAFTFFPSTIAKTDRFVAFAPDFRGTVFAYALDALPTGIAPTVWQQSTLSAYLAALRNAGGLQAKVPTTAIYSTTDEVVEPEEGPGIASSQLPGAKNVLVQDTCGPTFIVEHSQELFNAFTYKVAVSALQSPTGVARDQDYSSADCSEDFPAPLPVQDRVKTPTILGQAIIHIAAGPRVACEPKLKPYAAAYYPVPIQACNPLANIGQSFQTPPQFNDYESLAYYILTH